MPAEELAEVFLEVIEGGKSVSEGAKIIEFVADNGAKIAEGVTEVATAGNGVAAEVTAVTETAAATGATTTTGLGLLAVDVGAAGAAIAPALGILAGVGLYNLNEEFWYNVSNLLYNNGQTIGGKVQAILTSAGVTAFSQTTIEIFKEAFREVGLFDAGEIEIPDYSISGKIQVTSVLSPDILMTIATGLPNKQYVFTDAASSVITNFINQYWAPGKYAKINIYTDTGNYQGSSPFSIWISDNIILNTAITLGESIACHILSTFGYSLNTNVMTITRATIDSRTSNTQLQTGIRNNSSESILANINATQEPNPNVQPGATLPSTDPFPETYPDWNPVPVPESLPEPNYYPVEIPTQLPDQEPAQNPIAPGDPEPAPGLDIQPWIDWWIENFPIPEPNPNPYPEPGPAPEPDPDPQPEPGPAPEPDPEPVEPNPPDPNEPVVPDPVPFIPPVLNTVDSTKIFTVYNPTNAQLDALGAYLWSNDVLETIVKIWQNPLDGVISLRQVYCTPVAGGSHNIILGSLDSGVSAAVVTSQFATIDCGSVIIGEKNKNVTDYSPYATIHLYLPFIGIVQLDVDEVMNSTLNVKYTIDVYTGTCLAEIYVTRSPDMTVSKILYTFSGNCSQTLPLTASDATGLASSLASLGAAAIGIVAGGGALGAVAGASMVGHSLTHEMINIGHSGSLSSNAGIMGQRKPYVIIGRRHGYDANSYNEIYGYPTNKTVFLSNCTGYIRVKAINLQSAATEEEKKEIIQLLKQGVIM